MSSSSKKEEKEEKLLQSSRRGDLNAVLVSRTFSIIRVFIFFVSIDNIRGFHMKMIFSNLISRYAFCNLNCNILISSSRNKKINKSHRYDVDGRGLVVSRNAIHPASWMPFYYFIGI